MTSLNIFETVYQLCDKESICLGNIGMLKVVVKRWSRNRPEDETRVVEIARLIEETGRVDGLISLAVTPEGIVCWDGLHRFKALCRVATPPRNVLYHVWMNPSEDDIKDRFISINKAVAVPSLYTDKTTPAFKATCEKVMKNCMYFYKDHFSSAARPLEPNINRDVFLQIITDFLSEHPSLDASALMKLIRQANESVAASDLSSVKPKTMEKCLKTQCFLFLRHVSLPVLLKSMLDKEIP